MTSPPAHTAPTISGQNPSRTLCSGSPWTFDNSVVDPVVSSHTPTSSALTTAKTTVWMKRPRISRSFEDGVVGRTVVGVHSGHHGYRLARRREKVVDDREVHRHARGVERIRRALAVEVPAATEELVAEREHVDLRPISRRRDRGERHLGLAEHIETGNGA